MDTSPPSLLEQLRRPAETAAWERFVQLYTPLLCHWARRLGLLGADAADLVEDVFAVLADRLSQLQYDPGQRFRVWLWAITLDVLHARRQLAAQRLESEGEPYAVAVAEPAGGLGEEEYRQYLVRRTLELIREEFPPATWRAFWEFAVAGRPAEDVARELGMNIGAVYLARGRVVRRLRDYLAGLLT
jgi:RNA polymerase sigma-70 factor (ECF subfamily)